MDKGAPSGLFANDGSFMERFKQLQQETGNEKGKDQDQGVASVESKCKSNAPGVSVPKPVCVNIRSTNKAGVPHKTATPSGGKLAFSLKQKSKLVAPAVKLDEDEEDEVRDTGNASGIGEVATKRLKLGHPYSSNQSSPQVDVAPHLPSDPTVKNIADKLASFVAKHGRSFEHVTRQKNPGDTPFKFLFDESCADYKYYEFRLHEEEKALAEANEYQTLKRGGSTSNLGADASRRSVKERSNYQTPASALYDGYDANSSHTRSGGSGESVAPSGTDPIAMMEYYVKKAEQEERKRPHKKSHDEMPPPSSLQGLGKRGHHMGDYIPLEELDKFLATCNDASAQKASKEAADRARIQADNVGHKLLSKMGWKEGEGLGSSKKGMADPIMAGDVKTNNLGVGAHNPGEVRPDDDIYEQYKKRMMLGYRHRPNPLNNPRKAYY